VKHQSRQLAALILVAGFLVAPAVTAARVRSLREDAHVAVRVERDLTYGTAGGQRLLLDAYLPGEQGAPRPAVVFVHGGGWRSGDKTAFASGEQSFAPSATRLVQLGFAVFSVDYRLAPGARYPAAVDDIATAIRWIRAQAGRFGVDPRRLGLFGASAGGNLAALAASRGRGRLDTGARVRAVVSWSGPMDLTLFDAELGGPSQHPFVEEYIGCAPTVCPARYRAASPLTDVDRSDPPMLLVNSTGEIVPLAQAREMAARLTVAAVPHELLVLPGSRHAAQYASTVWQQTVRFLKRHLR
jgi:acetyl esterase/lipase